MAPLSQDPWTANHARRQAAGPRSLDTLGFNPVARWPSPTQPTLPSHTLDSVHSGHATRNNDEQGCARSVAFPAAIPVRITPDSPHAVGFLPGTIA